MLYMSSDGIRVESTRFTDARILVPVAHDDHRGVFMETYSWKKYAALGVPDVFVQDNVSFSARNVIRGMHGAPSMAKLISCIRGRIFDCIIDVRMGSPTYLDWQGFYLTAENRRQLYVPAGFAHGFFSLSDVVVSYKQSVEHNPVTEFQLRWNDPLVGIKWPGNPRYPLLSDRDANAPLLIPGSVEVAA